MNHGVVSGVDISSGGPAAPSAPAAPPPPSNPNTAPRERRRIDQLDDAFTETPQNELLVDMGATPVDAVEEDPSQNVQPNDGLGNEPAPELPAEYAELKAKWDSPELPEELEDRLVTVDFENGAEPMTIADLKKAAMRHADYSRKTTEVAQLRKQAQAGLQGQQRLVEALSSPQTFVQGLETLAQFEPRVMHAFEDAVKTYVEQEIADFEAVGRNHELLQRVKEGRRSQREAEHYKRRLQERDAADARAREEQGRAQAPDVQLVVKQLAQFVPRAFQAAGLPESGLARQMVGPELNVFWADRTKPLTYAMVQDAAKAIKQKIIELHGADSVKMPTPPRQEAPPAPARAPAAAPPQGGRRTQKRIDELGGDWWSR